MNSLNTSEAKSSGGVFKKQQIVGGKEIDKVGVEMCDGNALVDLKVPPIMMHGEKAASGGGTMGEKVDGELKPAGISSWRKLFVSKSSAPME